MHFSTVIPSGFESSLEPATRFRASQASTKQPINEKLSTWGTIVGIGEEDVTEDVAEEEVVVAVAVVEDADVVREVVDKPVVVRVEEADTPDVVDADVVLEVVDKPVVVRVEEADTPDVVDDKVGDAAVIQLFVPQVLPCLHAAHSVGYDSGHFTPGNVQHCVSGRMH
jgi:hypothetical protein